MSSEQNQVRSDDFVVCMTCGLVQRVPRIPLGFRAKCARCNFEVLARKVDSRRRTVALALGALILYFPANLFPLFDVRYWGLHQTTTMFGGIYALLQRGSYFVGGLVFMTSMITPAIKILALLGVSLTLGFPASEKFRWWCYRTVQLVDPWIMLGVTVLAMVVGLVEIHKIATVLPGPGFFSFAGVMLLTTCASIAFDPRLAWGSAQSMAAEGGRGKRI